MDEHQLYLLEHEIGMRADRCISMLNVLDPYFSDTAGSLRFNLTSIVEISRKLYFELTGNKPWDTSIENEDGSIKEENL